MKKKTILILTFYLSMTIFGQVSYGQTIMPIIRNVEHEIGLNCASILNLNFKKPVSVDQSIINGITYKRHVGNDALKIGIDVFRYKFYNDYTYANNRYPDIDYGSKVIGEFRLGYERTLLSKKIRPFFGCDLIFSYGQTTGRRAGGMDAPLGIYPYYNYTTKEIHIGWAPLIGLSYRITDKLSLTIESNLSISYYFNNDESSRDYDKEVRIYLSPLRLLSINYHIQNNKKIKSTTR